jgi:hypothetical protein
MVVSNMEDVSGLTWGWYIFLGYIGEEQVINIAPLVFF